jgi:hypothetical protein
MNILKRLSLTLLFLSLACAVKAEQPNIILIVGDDVGFSDIGA